MGLGFRTKRRYAVGSDLPIGFQNLAATKGWFIPAGLIALVGELPHRF